MSLSVRLRASYRPVFLAYAIVCAISTPTSLIADVSIIPKPTRVTEREGSFVLQANATVSFEGDAEKVAEYLVKVFNASYKTNLSRKGNEHHKISAGGILLSTKNAPKNLGDEGYILDITPDRVEIRANARAGLFYAVQTLRQLLMPSLGDPNAKTDTPADRKIPCMRIEDQPRFGWRGMMLDPARYFLTKKFIKQFIDQMAYYKLNRLQLHLTDHESWTIEIKKYPELTDFKRWPSMSGKRTRGVYTQKDICEIVAYASARNVEIIPEIDMPGHSSIIGWTLSDQLLCPNNLLRDKNRSCNARTIQVWSEPCLSNPKTYEFYQGVLREIITMFPGRYIHIGGDEYFGEAWGKCPDCEKLIESQNLRRFDSDELKKLFGKCKGYKKKYLHYRYFMTQISDFVRAQGRQPLLWDDLAWRGQFPEAAVIMQWHCKDGMDCWQLIKTPENPATEAAKAGHDAITAPYSHLYFDINSTLEQVYRFDPMPQELAPDKRPHILGPHAPLWEQPQGRVNVQAFPRLFALAEIGWSPKQSLDYKDFTRRVDIHQKFRTFMAGESLLGRWTPDQMLPRRMHATLKWDASRFITRPGNFSITFRYQAGKEGANIECVSLLENGKEILRDQHSGWCGVKPLDEIYSFRVPQIQRNAKYEIQAKLWIPSGGNDSTGSAFIAREDESAAAE